MQLMAKKSGSDELLPPGLVRTCTRPSAASAELRYPSTDAGGGVRFSVNTYSRSTRSSIKLCCWGLTALQHVAQVGPSIVPVHARRLHQVHHDGCAVRRPLQFGRSSHANYSVLRGSKRRGQVLPFASPVHLIYVTARGHRLFSSRPGRLMPRPVRIEFQAVYRLCARQKQDLTPACRIPVDAVPWLGSTGLRTYVLGRPVASTADMG